MSLGFDGFDYLTASFSGPVDELRFIGSGDANWWLIDDFTYAVVPLPSAVLTGLGLLLGLGAVRSVRRRKTSSSP